MAEVDYGCHLHDIVVILAAVDLLLLCNQVADEIVIAFEYMPHNGLALAFKHFPTTRFCLVQSRAGRY